MGVVILMKVMSWNLSMFFTRYILSIVIGVLMINLINKFYAKGDKKKIGYALFVGLIVALVWFYFN